MRAQYSTPIILLEISLLKNENKDFQFLLLSFFICLFVFGDRVSLYSPRTCSPLPAASGALWCRRVLGSPPCLQPLPQRVPCRPLPWAECSASSFPSSDVCCRPLLKEALPDSGGVAGSLTPWTAWAVSFSAAAPVHRAWLKTASPPWQLTLSQVPLGTFLEKLF